MTKPKEFYENVVNAMEYLDTILPNGSHVLLTGLANGSLLYQSIGNNIYPIGRVKNDVKYSDVYTYLSCLQVSPW
jgi:acyloxyacyl hydrolase